MRRAAGRQPTKLGVVSLMLLLLFASTTVGLLLPGSGQRQAAIVAVLAILTTGVYWAFSEKFM
jgi:hypothetical protein